MQEKELEGRWLLLIHQIPPKPDYFRVKIWRRLQKLGSVAVKNSVYVLPKNDQAQEDFQWILREIVAGRGDATLCEARFVDGLSDDEVVDLFQAARSSDYQQIAEEARRIEKSLPAKLKVEDERRRQAGNEMSRLKRRVAEVVAIDFFDAPGREATQGLIGALEGRLRLIPNVSDNAHAAKARVEEWLVRRFIDPHASFKFVPAKGYKPLADEIRFDMFEAEFTHEGDRCTMEVLIDRTGIENAGLRLIAEIVHDIDLKDSKFCRQETIGIERLITGIAMANKNDEARLERDAPFSTTSMNTSEGKAVERPVKNQSENPVKLLHVERLSKSFSGFNALCDVSFDLREQDVPGIIGHMESEKPQCWNVLRDSCQSIAERSAGTTSASRLAGEKM